MKLSCDHPIIYLASASPRRSALLKQIVVPHIVRPVVFDETLLANEAPADYVKRLASGKAMTLWKELTSGDRLGVLGADTAVVLEREIFGKPADKADAVRMLQKLAGRTHEVYTAVALRHAGGVDVRLSVSEVEFRELSRAECEEYWDSSEPADKAGAYAVQGRAACFIRRLSGSYSGIMGLPLFETAQLLEALYGAEMTTLYGR